MYCEKINSFERDYLKLHAVVVVTVHSPQSKMSQLHPSGVC
jgi:hypothetical protein